jgi:hypothetical protein
MPITPGRSRVSKIAAALALGAAMLASGAARAQAPLSPVDKLVAEDDIRQKLALYGILTDGDGVAGKNIRGLVDQIMTPDVWTDLYYPDGSLQVHTVGREAIVTSTPIPKSMGPIANRHYLIATYFDELTPTTAKTRTTMMWMQVTRNLLGADCAKGGPDACGGRVVSAMTTVYHNDWVKTADGWRMSRNVIRRDD